MDLPNRFASLAPALAASALVHGLGLLAASVWVSSYDPGLLSSAGAPRLNAYLAGKRGNAIVTAQAGNKEATAAASGDSGSAPEGKVVDMQEHGPLSLPVADEPYYSAHEVDRRISALAPIELDTDQVNMLAPHQAGKIQIKLWIDKTGKVNRAEVLHSDMPPPVTDQAVTLFAHSRFQPATRQGQAVNAVSVIEIDYAEEPTNRTFPPNVPNPPLPVPSAKGN